MECKMAFPESSELKFTVTSMFVFYIFQVSKSLLKLLDKI